MSGYAVIKGTAYTLAAAQDMVLHNGTTQTTEMVVNPGSEYLVALPGHLRSFDEIAAYIPNQVYIGNAEPEVLKGLELPWYDKKLPEAPECLTRGRFGEILPQDMFIGLIQICDVFDLVKLEKSFAAAVQEKLGQHPLIGEERAAALAKNEDSPEEILALVENEHAEAIYFDGKLVGAVKRAHDVDVNLSAHVMLENLVTKASSVLSLLNLVKVAGIDPAEVEYVIDCCEEACGDMNQRGGGNFAKAAAEVAGLTKATGSDVRGFCAGPAHAILSAASLVKAGSFKNVVVTAGGCTAKLGMNGKDHVKKGMPVLEDVIAGFSVLISADDGVSPIIRNDVTGRHTVGTGSSPQAVISALVTDALDKEGLKITDVDKYAPEMQNPDITKPAGAGDVPEANYKMIAALGVKQGVLERAGIVDFVKEHGMPGWAPTQGHIPSGVPYLGFAREELLAGKIHRAMIIGKGSLFLGRMTNLFDGVSFLLEANPGSGSTCGSGGGSVAAGLYEPQADAAGNAAEAPVIGIAAEGSEHGMEEIHLGAKMAAELGYRALVIEGGDVHKKMEAMLAAGEIQGAVTMHYPFPIGVSTIGKVVTPGKGKAMYLAATTGTSDTDRTAALVKNAVYGMIAAKASGVSAPTVGIANIDGARQAEKALLKLAAGGYDIRFAESERADGGVVMRGNDLLTATADIMVMDALTGNLMMKIFSASQTGGSYESTGWGYGPGIGPDYENIVMIISRASGAPVIAGAVEYASKLIRGGCAQIAREEFAKARKAGLEEILKELKGPRQGQGPGAAGTAEAADAAEVKAPPKEVVTAQIPGIEVMDLEDAVAALWAAGIYAESGMGCTGPIVMISEANKARATEVLEKAGYIG